MEPVTSLVVLAYGASAFVLVGIIWTVQVVHYPLMALVGEDRFVAYEAAHAPRMAAVVMVPWTLQGATTLALLVTRPERIPLWLVAAAAIAAAVPVAVTVIWSVPAHARLAEGFDPAIHRRLVRTNWVRTGAWTAHAPIAVAILLRGG